MIPLVRAFEEAVGKLTDAELLEAEVFVNKLTSAIRIERFARREVRETDPQSFWVET